MACSHQQSQNSVADYSKVLSMRNTALLAITLLLLSTPACKQQMVNRPSEPKPSLMLREGDYLSTTYIDELKRTRSPLKACPSACGVKLVTVEKGVNLWRLMPIYNFHEGGEALVLRPDGVVNHSQYISHVTLSVKDASSFRLGFDEGAQSFRRVDYVFVQKAETFAAKAVLVGSYRDGLGRVYRFQEDGTAIFPGRKFKFEIGVDHIGTDFDYFMEMGPNRRAVSSMAFRWQADSLQLFRIKEDENGLDYIADNHPYLTLKQTQ